MFRALLLSAATIVPNIHAAEFFPLDFAYPSNRFGPWVEVSSDGGVLVASTVDNELVRWTKQDGADVLLHSDVARASISGDGRTIVTAHGNSLGVYEATIIRDNDVSYLPIPPLATSSSARRISEDGSTIVGSIDGIGATWVDKLITELPFDIGDSSINAISGDGHVMGGWEFRWSSTEGLQELPGMYVHGVSQTGRWAVGETSGLVEPGVPLFTIRRALLWDGWSEPKEIPGPFDDWGSIAKDVSADGSFVGGRLYRTPDDGNFNDLTRVLRAGFWTEGSERMMLFQDLLTNQYAMGEELEGWILAGIDDITSDGRHVAGWGYNPDGDREAFLVDLGIRGDLNGDENLDITDVNELVAAIGAGTDDLRFDINWSNAVDMDDLDYWVHKAKETFFGDANLDGEFNSGDLVDVFQAGQYEDTITGNSTWDTGDWNADGEFTTSDLVTAFQDGGYEQGPRAAIQAVPEPTSLVTILTALATGLSARRARRVQPLRRR